MASETHHDLLEQRQSTWGYIAPDRWRAVAQYAQGTVLDVGCANGVYVERLLSQQRTAYGIDLLRYAAWQQLPGRILQANAVHLPFKDNAFDTLLSFETVEHVPGPLDALREYHRVCRNTLIMSVPNTVVPEAFQHAGLTYHHWVDRSHVNFYTPDSLRAALVECGFEPVKVELINPTLPAYPLLRALRVPPKPADLIARALRKVSPEQYRMSILAVARKK